MEETQNDCLIKIAQILIDYVRTLHQVHAFEARCLACLRLNMRFNVAALLSVCGESQLGSQLRQVLQETQDKIEYENEDLDRLYNRVISIGLFMEGKSIKDVNAYFQKEDELRSAIDQLCATILGTPPIST